MIVMSPGDDALQVEDVFLAAPPAGTTGARARILQLNRPRQRNALNTSLLEALEREIGRAAADPLVRAVVLCGTGGTFCAGGDTKEFDGTESSRAGVVARSKLLLDVASGLENSPVPTLAVVAGAAAGGGAVLALACDAIIAGPDMRLGFPELRSEVVPSLVMPSAIATFGRRGAFDLVTSGRLLDVPELVARGVVECVVDPEELRETVTDVLHRWASVSSEAMAATKHLLNAMAEMAPEEAAKAGLDATAALWKPQSS